MWYFVSYHNLPQLSVIVDEVVSCGITPLETVIVGEIGPKYKISPAPEEAVPIAKNDSVSLPEVAVGNVIVEIGETDEPETVQPFAVPTRETATRA